MTESAEWLLTAAKECLEGDFHDGSHANDPDDPCIRCRVVLEIRDWLSAHPAEAPAQEEDR